MRAMLEISDVGKSFTMHLQDGLRLPVVTGVNFVVRAGECVALGGPSGAGKSSILKMIFGNYRCDAGHICVQAKHEAVDVARAEPRRILALRRDTIGYVSQFLRAVPRVPALDVVAAPLIDAGVARGKAREAGGRMLARMNIPERLWGLPPATFSGGEQQRINLARGFLPEFPILLLDEPTASLDAANRAVAVDLVEEKKRQGVAIVAIIHDDDVREAIADRVIDVTRFAAAA
jgi:alpha-D-ribose 1-methylphosphonate 5-triphosphate synthase subunit PhnL